MQLRVHRHDAQARMPSGPHQLDVLGRILHRQRDAVSGLHAGQRAQPARQTRDALLQSGIAVDQFIAERKRRRIRKAARGGVQESGYVHGGTSIPWCPPVGAASPGSG
jgi:hypothetical protein